MTVKRFFPISTEYLWKWQKKKNNGPKTVVPLSAVSFIRCNISPGIGMSSCPFPLICQRTGYSVREVYSCHLLNKSQYVAVGYRLHFAKLHQDGIPDHASGCRSVCP